MGEAERGNTLPKVPETAFVERRGVIRVEDVTNAARCIWRETLMRDVGIDGQIEYVDPEGQATGRFVAVQVKSGKSYFSGSDEDYVGYTPSEKHRRYWERSPIPVIVVLHDPSSDALLWTDARAAIRDGRADPIRIPRSDVFDAEGVLKALQSDGPLPRGALDPAAVIDGCTLSFFDLFFQGLTNFPVWHVYFGMDLIGETADVKTAVLGTEGGIGIGPAVYDFVDRYVAFLIAYDLARVDYDSFARVSRTAEMVGRVLSPLTERGNQLVAFVHALDGLLEHRTLSSWVAQERAVQMVMANPVDRTAHIEFFKEQLPALLARRRV
jgi:hypothetical protein